jgi:hypothetical protein
MTKRTRKTAAAPVAASEVIVQGNEPTNEQNTNESADTVEQSDELQAMIDAEDNVPDTTDEPASDTPEVIDAEQFMAEDDVADPETGEGTESQGTDPAEVAPETAPEPEVAAAPVDPFADLPMTKVEDYEFRDLTDAVGNDPFKYDAVHKAAIEAKLPVKSGWKHSAAMVVKGQNRKEFKPGSVYGTIDQIVMQYGRAGVPAYVLVAKVRQLQIGNKRSKYCTALPPIGWAEGWIDTYISKNHGKVMEKKAPPITQQLVEQVKADDIKAEREGDRIAA